MGIFPDSWFGSSQPAVPNLTNFNFVAPSGPVTPSNSLSDPGAQSFTNLLSGGGNQGGMAGLGWNIPTMQLGFGAANTLANFWNGWQAQNLAKQQFNLVRDTTNTNTNNQIKSYNTALEDRARARGVAEGQSPDQVAAYVNANRLSR